MPESSTDLLPGFRWAVVRGFRLPLGACRFEEGDLLYDSPEPYRSTWAEALPFLKGAIQVVSPARAPTTRQDADEESVFHDNWRQPAVVRVTTYPSGETKTVRTTQGRLYTAIWKGDLSVLSISEPEPPVPLRAGERKPYLPDAATAALAGAALASAEICAFAMPFDETSDLGSKFRKVEAALRGKFDARAHIVAPSELKVAHAEMFVPTARIACFVVGAARVPVEAALKKVLYVPSKDRKTAVDRFRLEAHGSLLARQFSRDATLPL